MAKQKKDAGEKHAGGRPRHAPSEELREQVAILAGAGMAHAEIALVVGIARQTLETYYPSELSIGAFRKRAEVMAALHQAAIKGSVAAARAYLSAEPKHAAPPEEADTPALGKKEQANADAVRAAEGTDWSDLLDDVATVPN